MQPEKIEEILPRFEAKTKRSKASFVEPYWLIRFYRQETKMRFVKEVIRVSVEIVLLAISTILLADGKWNGLDYVLVLGWTAIALNAYMIAASAQIHARKELKRPKRSDYGTLYILDDCLKIESALSNEVYTVPLNEINDVKETKSYYIIIFDNRCGYTVVEKAGFEKGTAEEAYQFICSKMNRVGC